MDLTYCIVLWDESEISGQEEYIWVTFGIHLEYIWEKYILDVHFSTFLYIYLHPHPKKKPPFWEIEMYIWDTFRVHLEYICIHLAIKYISIHLSENVQITFLT